MIKIKDNLIISMCILMYVTLTIHITTLDAVKIFATAYSVSSILDVLIYYIKKRKNGK